MYFCSLSPGRGEVGEGAAMAMSGKAYVSDGRCVGGVSKRGEDDLSSGGVNGGEVWAMTRGVD